MIGRCDRRFRFDRCCCIISLAHPHPHTLYSGSSIDYFPSRVHSLSKTIEHRHWQNSSRPIWLIFMFLASRYSYSSHVRICSRRKIWVRCAVLFSVNTVSRNDSSLCWQLLPQDHSLSVKLHQACRLGRVQRIWMIGDEIIVFGRDALSILMINNDTNHKQEFVNEEKRISIHFTRVSR
jgi:hypothetical protein